MKRNIIFIFVFSFTVIAVCLIAITIVTAEDSVYQYYVDAYDNSTAYQYLDTGINIVAGTELKITASGIIFFYRFYIILYKNI